MRKVMLMVVLFSFCSVSAYAVILGSKHDLTTANLANVPVLSASDVTETCVFCHTPHGASNSGTAPLWNRINDTTPTGTYGDPTGSMEFAPDAADVAATDAILCMSCHDGTVTGNLNNPPATGQPTLTEDWSSSDADLTTTMADDHPIGMSYGDAEGSATETELVASPGLPFFTQTLVAAGNAGVHTDVMWCSSCHDVHGKAGVEMFLQTTNAGSALCTTCHIK